jgi:hypothetical protein
MRFILISFIIIHGIIHLIGFIKAFNIAPINKLKENISKPAGILWLINAILFLIAGIFYFMQKDYWWMFAAPAVILSQILIILAWSDARFGTIANFIILVPIIISFAGSLPSSYKNIFKAEAEKGLERYAKQPILTQEDIKNLPSTIQKYIIYSGALGKEKVQNFRAVFNGGFKPDPNSDFLDFTAVQYNFFDEPERLFFIELYKYGIPFAGLHIYKGSNAAMQIKLASLYEIVNAKGPEMNKGETVTLFNDMCVLAPASLISKNIEWEIIDSLTVKGRFTNQGNTITAVLYFNEKGELINFSSDDRYESVDGKVYKNYKWTTPLKNYRDYNGRKAASYGEAVWHKPEGELCYGKFNLEVIEFNCRKFK